jgi:hypothetical protein
VGDLTPSVLALPYCLVLAAVLVLGAVTVATRGDVVVRLSVLTLVAGGLPFALAFVIAASTTDPELARLVYRFGYGGVALAGAGLLMMVLAVSGRFDSYRPVVALAYVCACASAVVCWSTDWVVRGVHETPSGLFYTTPGPFQMPLVGQIPLWGGIGMLISRRGMRAARDARWRAQRRRAVAVIVLCSITLLDALLAHEIWGYYPVAWIPILFAIGVAVHSIVRADLLRATGVDHPALFEAAALIGVTAFLYAVTWDGDRTLLSRPVVAAVFLAPLPMLGLVGAWTLRIRRRRAETTDDDASLAIDALTDDLRELDDEASVARRLAAVLAAHAPISSVRVWLCDDAGLRPLVVADGGTPRIDARVRAWLVANPDPLLRAELPSRRLGGLRSLVEEMVEAVGADLIVPLVDRDALVGVAAATLPPYRVLRDGEREFVRSLATAAARGLTFVSLTREAGHLSRTEREVELADAVAQARTTGDVSLQVGEFRVLGHYRPAAKVAYDIWSCAELRDGRVLLFVGDVVGRGLPSALVSAAVGGVCETVPAVVADTIEPRAVLELAHATVRDLGEGNQRVTAFAAVVGDGAIRWASAGHRGAYLVHPPPASGDDRARLEVLGARSTPLGDPGLVVASGDRALAAGDHVVICADGVVDIRDGRGDPWGDRRLQRLLRDQLLAAGDKAARMLVAAAVAHAGDAPIHDDLLVVVVRPGPG